MRLKIPAKPQETYKLINIYYIYIKYKVGLIYTIGFESPNPDTTDNRYFEV